VNDNHPFNSENQIVKHKNKIMNLLQRITAPTPSFFKKIRKLGIILATISGAILAAPLVLPPALITAATYLGIAGSVATAVSQTASETDDKS
jgi:hypothetical protein